MGIIDFREIISPNAAHAAASNSPIGKSAQTNDFEQFCRAFFARVLRWKIFKEPQVGPDDGIDVGVEDLDGVRWLVSCKHKAHSGAAVGIGDEARGIVERVGAWDCDGFIAFYSTPPTSGIRSDIDGASRFVKVQRYFPEQIESTLLGNSQGIELAARFFPKSMENHYRRIIKTADTYSLADIELDDLGCYKIGKASMCPGAADGPARENALKQLVRNANLYETMEQHRFYFTVALKDAIKAAPAFFVVDGDPQTLDDFVDVAPTWDPAGLAKAGRVSGGLQLLYFVGAVWSFWDYGRAQRLFSEAMVLRSNSHRYENGDPLPKDEFEDSVNQKSVSGLLTPGLIGLKLQEDERDIVVRLMAFMNPIPTRSKSSSKLSDEGPEG